MKNKRDSLETPKNLGKLKEKQGRLTQIISDKNLLARPDSLSPLCDSPSSGSPGRILLNPVESEQLQVKLRVISKKLLRMKTSILNCTKNIVEIVQSLEKQALNEVLEAEFEINALMLKIEKGEPVDLDLFQMMKEIRLRKRKNFEISAAVKENLAETFKVPEELIKISGFRRKSIRSRKSSDSGQIANLIIPDDDNFDDTCLIFARNYDSGLISVDLSSFKEKKLPFAPRILPYHILCKISSFKYFVSGGYDGSRSTGDTFIVDLSRKTCSKLSSSIERDGAGSVFKDQKVFIFGGIHTNEEDLQLCQYFDLKLNSWHTLPDLPIKSHANTATLVDDWIILTGFHMGGVYIFDGTSYVNLLNLQPKSFKYLFGHWVIDGKTIFKVEDFSNNLWLSFNCSKELKLGWLCCFSGFRKGKFVYFSEELNGILRLDTELKRIDVIEMS